MSNEIYKLLVNAGTAINNSLQNENLKALIAEFRYGTERLTEGKALLENATALSIKQAKESGERVQLIQNRNEKKILTNKDYMKYVNIA